MRLRREDMQLCSTTKRRVLRAKRPRFKERVTIRLTRAQAKRYHKLSHTERRRFPIVIRDCFDRALDQWEAKL